MTRIAFASCMSALANAEQSVWREVAAHQPDWLVLCGDNIYMDYFPSLNQSRPWSLSRFADEMQMRYALQFEVENFRNLVRTIPAGQVIGVWDDHDFAWNNCFGTDPSDEMFAKKRIATALYHHYFSELNKRPLATKWQPLKIDDFSSPPNGSLDIYRALDIPPFRALLCDGRAYREKHPKGTTSGSLLGEKQERWLLDELRGPGPFLLISGSTMTAGDDQSWDYYQDFFKGRFLPAAAGKVVVFMAGDVHENRLPPKVGASPVEVVSSASVLKFPFNKRNFGIMEFAGHEARVFLYKRGKVEHAGVLGLDSGAFTTTMEVLLDDSVELVSSQVATEQRAAAMVELFKAQ